MILLFSLSYNNKGITGSNTLAMNIYNLPAPGKNSEFRRNNAKTVKDNIEVTLATKPSNITMSCFWHSRVTMLLNWGLKTREGLSHPENL